MSNPNDEYDRFLSGLGGDCVLCGSKKAFAWLDKDEIDAGYESRHETTHFIWLGEDTGDRPQGFVCDACIDRLVLDERIEAYYSDLNGPLADISNKAALKAHELGAQRMRALLALPFDASGLVSPEAFAALPPALRCYGGNEPAPIWNIILDFVGYTASRDDPEGSGRQHALARAAIGMLRGVEFTEAAKTWVSERSKQLRSRNGTQTPPGDEPEPEW
ncbi:hypothetical protein [Aquamicrobium sp. LC103]|uniref:hypothetical protein n=1 Tax=Aquamicrobium sp. LC103 TaxID=1120658 RepID=UPI00063EC1EA|nr:hypothetical protein [Aquamicrobium sp. LC103]TKT69781.1 hypothetical protein XW59_025150 [Aquamicrobium sp. LC103]